MAKIIKVRFKTGVYKGQVLPIPEREYNKRIHEKNLMKKEKKDVTETKEEKKSTATKVKEIFGKK